MINYDRMITTITDRWGCARSAMDWLNISHMLHGSMLFDDDLRGDTTSDMETLEDLADARAMDLILERG